MKRYHQKTHFAQINIAVTRSYNKNICTRL